MIDRSPEYLISHTEEIFSKCVDTMKMKNADYSGSDANAFRNFEGVEYFKVCETKIGMMVRLTDKFMRISHLLKKPPQVKTESLKDSIEDAINYLAIMHAYITAQENEATVDTEEVHIDDKIVKEAVDRFLGWQFPDDFHPDGGIQFTRYDLSKPGIGKQTPVGTNLLNAQQAEEMIRYILGATKQ